MIISREAMSAKWVLCGFVPLNKVGACEPVCLIG
jgi:hypothetical protein